MAGKNSIKGIAAIVERGRGKLIVKEFKQNQIEISLQCLGNGTASSELMDVLGLGSSEKDILLGIAASSVIDKMMVKMDDSETQLNARGMIFDLQLTGLNSIIATVLLHQGQENGGAEMEQSNTASSLILVTVNQGYTEEVMDTARSAGARGGTIIRARWSGDKDSEKFYGINVQAEKEIIIIIAHGDNRNAIMETINKKHGLSSDASAMICSLPIDHVVKI
ncbi:hypothetical protein LJC58_08665 [Lachnospiraceae bacterium OttesenSCG-928-D06]|nr:hypothetical protein [Lachnospiraceae bacterium OttesenSCG-928-D06]